MFLAGTIERAREHLTFSSLLIFIHAVIDYVDAGEIMVVQPEVVGKKRERASIAPPPDVTRSPTFCDDGENGDTCESRSSSAADSDVESDTRPQRLFVSRLTGGPLPLAAARAAIRDLLNALSHAHALGIAHRDVKPENALMSHDGLLKLADWGAAQHFDGDTLADAGRGVTTNDSSCATPPSPIAAAVVADSAASTCPVHCAEKARPKSLRPAWVANTVGTFLFLPSEAVGDNRGLRLGDPGDSGTVQQQHVLQRDAGGDAAADNSEVPAVLAVPPQLDSCTCCPALPVDGSYDAFAADVWAAGVTAHVLLFGVLPFGIGRATSLVEAMELISQGSALCPLPLQRAYSPDELGRDKDTLQSLEQLLGALLDRSPLTRATAAEALDLPFLNGFADADSAPSLRYPAIDESSLPRYTPAQVISAEIQPEEDEGGLVLQHEEEARHQHVDARGGNTVLQNNGDATPSSGRRRRAWSIMSRFIGALSRLFLRKGRQA